MHSRKDLIKHLVTEGNGEAMYATRTEAEHAVNSVLEAIMALIEDQSEDSLSLNGFGTFRRVKRAARKGRNPGTGAVIDIPESVSVTFKPSQRMKDRLKG